MKTTEVETRRVEVQVIQMLTSSEEAHYMAEALSKAASNGDNICLTLLVDAPDGVSKWAVSGEESYQIASIPLTPPVKQRRKRRHRNPEGELMPPTMEEGEVTS